MKTETPGDIFKTSSVGENLASASSLGSTLDSNDAEGVLAPPAGNGDDLPLKISGINEMITIIQAKIPGYMPAGADVLKRDPKKLQPGSKDLQDLIADVTNLERDVAATKLAVEAGGVMEGILTGASTAMAGAQENGQSAIGAFTGQTATQGTGDMQAALTAAQGALGGMGLSFGGSTSTANLGNMFSSLASDSNAPPAPQPDPSAGAGWTRST